jgi:hypothetical protein
MTDQRRLTGAPRAQSAFRIAAFLLVACIPLIALDGANALGPLGTSVLAVTAAGATVFTALAWRWVGPLRHVAASNLPFALGAAHIQAVSLVTQATPRNALAARTAQVPVPVLWVAVTDDGHRVELNQN